MFMYSSISNKKRKTKQLAVLFFATANSITAVEGECDICILIFVGVKIRTVMQQQTCAIPVFKLLNGRED